MNKDIKKPSRYLLENLVCPITKSNLRYDRESQELISDTAGIAYPVINGIPVLVERKARIIAEN